MKTNKKLHIVFLWKFEHFFYYWSFGDLLAIFDVLMSLACHPEAGNFVMTNVECWISDFFFCLQSYRNEQILEVAKPVPKNVRPDDVLKVYSLLTKIVGRCIKKKSIFNNQSIFVKSPFARLYARDISLMK